MTPKTSLDERFSDPGAEAVAWPATQQVIENAELFWVTTVRADGRPRSTPPVALSLRGAVNFPPRHPARRPPRGPPRGGGRAGRGRRGPGGAPPRRRAAGAARGGVVPEVGR